MENTDTLKIKFKKKTYDDWSFNETLKIHWENK